MQKNLFDKVIFSPGKLAIELAKAISNKNQKIFLFSPTKSIKDNKNIKNITVDFSLIQKELDQRGYDLMTLMKKHPLLFSTIARQVQSELIAKAIIMANNNEIDILHVYMNEEELAMNFTELSKKPVVFTHHEPYNFLAKYRTSFPKHKDKNFISISYSQRRSMPHNTNWVGNVYHGVDPDELKPVQKASLDYFAYFGRIIEQKGVHLAISTAKKVGLKLKIAGKHYGDDSNDSYWKKVIEPEIDGKNIEFIGFVSKIKEKREFLGNAKALIIPSTWEEPFGMVMIESMSCGTPVIGLRNGAIPEVIQDKTSGFLVNDFDEGVREEYFEKKLKKDWNFYYGQENTSTALAEAIGKIDEIDRNNVRNYVIKNFSTEKMAENYLKIYKNLIY